MPARPCSAITKGGTACRMPALEDGDTCFRHSPEHREAALEASRRGRAVPQHAELGKVVAQMLERGFSPANAATPPLRKRRKRGQPNLLTASGVAEWLAGLDAGARRPASATARATPRASSRRCRCATSASVSSRPSSRICVMRS